MFLPCQFPGITGNTGNHKNDRKIPKSDQTLNQTTRDITNSVWEKSYFKN